MKIVIDFAEKNSFLKLVDLKPSIKERQAIEKKLTAEDAEIVNSIGDRHEDFAVGLMALIPNLGTEALKRLYVAEGKFSIYQLFKNEKSYGPVHGAIKVLERINAVKIVKRNEKMGYVQLIAKILPYHEYLKYDLDHWATYRKSKERDYRRSKKAEEAKIDQIKSIMAGNMKRKERTLNQLKQ
jgi:hypothetical protein